MVGSLSCLETEINCGQVDSWVTGEFSLSNSRYPQSVSRYHPYASHRSPVHLQASQSSQIHPTLPYSSWQSSLDNNTTSTITNPYSWTRQTYGTSYLPIDHEATSVCQQNAPSYVLPAPEHGHVPSLSFANSISRQPQGISWLEQMNSVSIPQQNTPMSPTVSSLTSLRSPKSCSVLQQSAQGTVSYGRSLPLLSIGKDPSSTPSNLSDTPPLSAASHRSSSGWQTEAALTPSYASSRGSCMGNKDYIVPPTSNAYEAQEPRFTYNAFEISGEAALEPAGADASHEALQYGLYDDVFQTMMPHKDYKGINASRPRISYDDLIASAKCYNGVTTPKNHHGLYGSGISTSVSHLTAPSS